jgi:hypothetical protein
MMCDLIPNSYPCVCVFLSLLLAFQKGMKLPGSRPDVVRTKSLSGPSPVGGAFGGTDTLKVLVLDDFEKQAAHYNMACAHARLGNLGDVSTVAYIVNKFNEHVLGKCECHSRRGLAILLTV